MCMNKINYEPLEPLEVNRPVDRINYIVNACSGKNVLDLGCWDETALSKKDTPFWLHSRISAVANNTIGIDKSSSLPDEGFFMPHSKIQKGDITDKDAISGFDVDIIVAGEVIEHLPNTLYFFKILKEAYPGKRLICTTPNATNFSNIFLGIFQRESTHCDHVNIYSYKSLNILAEKSNLSSHSLFPYYVKYPEITLRMKGTKRIVVRVSEKIVNMIEWLVPLYAGGYIFDVYL